MGMSKMSLVDIIVNISVPNFITNFGCEENVLGTFELIYFNKINCGTRYIIQIL